MRMYCILQWMTWRFCCFFWYYWHETNADHTQTWLMCTHTNWESNGRRRCKWLWAGVCHILCLCCVHQQLCICVCPCSRCKWHCVIMCHCCLDYKNDPYSQNDSCATICCRGDLKPYPMLLGCYDAKVRVCLSVFRSMCFCQFVTSFAMLTTS